MANKKGMKHTDAAKAKMGFRFTPDTKTEFLKHYARGLTVNEAAAKVGTNNVTVFRHVRKDPEFAKEFAKSRELSLDSLEDQLHYMARNGNITATFGMLRAFRSERWREGTQVKEAADTFAAAFASAMSTLTNGTQSDAANSSNAKDGSSTPVH